MKISPSALTTTFLLQSKEAIGFGMLCIETHHSLALMQQSMCAHMWEFHPQLLLQAEWRKLTGSGEASPEVTGVTLGHPF